MSCINHRDPGPTILPKSGQTSANDSGDDFHEASLLIPGTAASPVTTQSRQVPIAPDPSHQSLINHTDPGPIRIAASESLDPWFEASMGPGGR